MLMDDYKRINRKLDEMGAIEEEKREYWKWRKHHENLDYEFKQQLVDVFGAMDIYVADCGCERIECVDFSHFEYKTCEEHMDLYPELFRLKKWENTS